MRRVNACSSYRRNYASSHINPTLNGSSEIQCFEHSDGIEVRKYSISTDCQVYMCL